MARRKGRRRRKETNHKSNIQLACERLEARQLLAGDLFTSLGAMALPGPGSLPADTSDLGASRRPQWPKSPPWTIFLSGPMEWVTALRAQGSFFN